MLLGASVVAVYCAHVALGPIAQRQSGRLITVWSLVRIQLGPPTATKPPLHEGPHLTLATPAVVLFDLDGTLVDTAPDLTAAVNAVLREHHRPDVAVAAVRNMIGDGTAKMVERAFAATGSVPADLSPVVQRFLAVYAGGVANQSVVYPGVPETLEKLAAAGCRLAVCTNKPDALAEQLLTALDLRRHFAVVVGGDVPHRKPDPRHLQLTLERLGATGLAAVMVGDAGNDVASARAAGMPVVLVPYGYTAVPASQLGADVVLNAFGDLPVALGLG